MGYSATVAALNVVDFIMDRVTDPSPGSSSNSWTFAGKDYFYERGREHEDGRVTGTVYHSFTWTDGVVRCRPSGAVRVDADGKFITFPRIPGSVRRAARVMYADGSVHHYHRNRPRERNYRHG